MKLIGLASLDEAGTRTVHVAEQISQTQAAVVAELREFWSDAAGHLGRARVCAGTVVDLADVTVVPPVLPEARVICIGLNYRDHAAETGKEVPTEPVMFAKYANSLAPHDAVVPVPAIVDELDWEAELAVVIGKGGRDIPLGQALEHVAGYACANDLSARVLQRRGGQWTRGKAKIGRAHV